MFMTKQPQFKKLSKFIYELRSSNMSLLSKILSGVVITLSLVPPVSADSPFQVLPWNGYKAALSLTFDDGDPIHLDLAIPELNKRKLRGTFFLIAGKLDRQADWKTALASGQEIGNHSWDHKHLTEFGPHDIQKEVVKARASLEKTFGNPVIIYAYPFFETSPALEKVVDENAFIARGGYGTFDMKPDLDTDWSNIPSRAAMTNLDLSTYRQWIDQDLTDGSWSVFLIHGIEGTPWGYSPIPKKVFTGILDYLVSKQKEIWVAPFGEVGAYWKAQKTLEKIDPKQVGTTVTWAWQKPTPFPTGVVLKVKIEGDGIQVSQGGTPIKPWNKSCYLISFDAQELTVAGVAWKADSLKADLPPDIPK
jgi:peptidoglycan/xylan/chitin deacetylase (PgdA/CDA1 family)